MQPDARTGHFWGGWGRCRAPVGQGRKSWHTSPLVTVMLVPNTKLASVASSESWYKWADTIPSHDEPTLREPQTILEYLLKRHLGKREESRIIHAMK